MDALVNFRKSTTSVPGPSCICDSLGVGRRWLVGSSVLYYKTLKFTEEEIECQIPARKGYRNKSLDDRRIQGAYGDYLVASARVEKTKDWLERRSSFGRHRLKFEICIVRYQKASRNLKY